MISNGLNKICKKKDEKKKQMKIKQQVKWQWERNYDTHDDNLNQ